MKRFILALSLVSLAACESEPAAVPGESGGRAEGEVLGGTISDDMIALEQLTSQAPLAPREGPSSSAAASAGIDPAQSQVAGEAASPDVPAEASASE
jgi:hypothetical protein